VAVQGRIRSGHTNRRRIHAVWARTGAELETSQRIAAGIRAHFPGALAEARAP
jgi:hypothetical protein